MFSSRSFIVSGLTFRSLIYFEFIFVYGVRKEKIGLKIYWAWPCPSEQDPVSPSISPSRKLPYASYSSPSEGRKNENHNHRKLTNLITWTAALSNSMKWWAMPCRATQDGQVVLESSDKMWSTGEGNGKPLQYSGLENPIRSDRISCSVMSDSLWPHGL